MVRSRLAPQSRLTPRQRRTRGLLARFTLVFSLAILAVESPRFLRCAIASRWPVTAGRITSSRVTDEFSQLVMHRFSDSRIFEDRIRVTYLYSVAGQSHSGSHITVLTPYIRRTYRDERRLATGAVVQVHYRPSDPADAVLDAPFPAALLVLLLACLAVLAWSVVALRAAGTLSLMEQ